MKLQSILALVPAIIASVSAAPATRGTGPDPNQVNFETISYAGSGCPAGTVSNVASDDKTILTSVFDQFVAAVGPGLDITSSRKNCQMTLKIHYPGGFQFSIFEADYRGFVELEKNVNALQKSTYYFSGSQSQASLQTAFAGPKLGDNYLISDKLEQASVVWSPCGTEGLLNINAQVQVSKNSSAVTNAAGQLTVDSIDAKVTQKYSLQWQKC
ncbi:hypothetical protein Egran_00044 [Elaphomyces granulatus]|uniref:Secreted protein n=1 Tax=Elaphomyces granulatus TaxID=519963 RepID=A0A232M6Z7_9EURO|nr:hypothetical protein Egran_00044 [Elaphomyces granulatus]